MQIKIKLKQNSQKVNLDSAQYTLLYKSTDKTANYRILSSLIQENDLIFKINSSQLLNSNIQKKDYFKEILQYIRVNDLDYNYNKISDNNQQSIFGNLFSKNNTAHQAICYLPNNLWKSESFRSIMPISGARYYILNENNNKKILESMGKMMDSEILDFFKLIVFDPGYNSFQQMGLNSTKLSYNDLEDLLKDV